MQRILREGALGRRARGVLALGLLAAALTAAPRVEAAAVWIEGEQPAAAMMSTEDWYNQVKTEELSNGEWLSHYGAARQGLAQYRFQVAEAGQYRLWLRVNPMEASLLYRLDDADWAPVDLSRPRDLRNIAADGAADLRYVAWIDAGQLELARGGHVLMLRTESERANHGAIDCLLLTTEPFEGRGIEKPEAAVAGEAAPAAAATPAGATARPRRSGPIGTWAFTPARDTYSDRALLDLRELNEREAGEHGFIQLSADGSDFARGDGAPIRFWAVNTGIWSAESPQIMADHARFLAKRGVNMARWHGNITPKPDGARMTDFDAGVRDQLWRGVAAFKGEGIYVTASPYWANSCKPKPNWPVPRRGGTDMHALLFFDPALQDAYKAWLRAIYEPPNPYTGVPLSDEPAVAVIQIQNEDSLLFWTINNLKGADLDAAGRQFGEWLARKYGSVAAAGQAWQGAQVQGDNPGAGIVRFYNIWDMTQPQQPGSGKNRRLSDQLQFWTETMHGFNTEVERFLRQELGCRQLINAGNWKTADATLIEDCERYSYTANQVIAVNRYVGDTHLGENRGWAIVNGDRFEDRSVLIRPHVLATSLKQPVGHPFLITESSWVPPLSYQSEGPFLISVFESLTGVDSFYWFSFGAQGTRRPQWPNSPNAQWRQPSSANGYMPSIGKWVADTPEILGNFPAAALMFRRGYIQRGQTVVREARALQDMWDRRVPIIAETASYDPNRDRGDYAPESAVKADVNRLAFLTGPVEVVYGGNPADTRVIDLRPLIDEGRRTVRSVTGEVEWDYGNGICTLNAPKARGVTGFLSRSGTFQLGDLAIESGNDYATVLVVAMDDRPLHESAEVLVQCGTRARPTGWQQKPARWEDNGNVHQGFEIVNYGRAPWQIIANDVVVTLTNEGVTEAVALDMNGMPRGNVPLTREGAAVTFQMPRDAKYLILR